MNKNSFKFLTCFQICILYIILVSDKSFAAHYQYEACVPRSCGNGPNISFPFIIQGLQEEYCGYPGFVLNCNENRFPILRLSDANDYVIDEIFYDSRSLRVRNALIPSLDGSSSSSNSSGTCFVPRILNTTLNGTRFNYFNATSLHLFSNCSTRLDNSFNTTTCDVDGEGEGEEIQNWSVVMYNGDVNLSNATGSCERNVVVPVEWREADDGRISGFGEALDVLRRGVMLNWTASDCTRCQDSGGRCGFNASAYHFQCFCPARAHRVRCRGEKSQTIVIVASAVSGGAFLLLICLGISAFWLRRKRINNAYIISRSISSDPSSKSDIEVGSFYYGIPIFCYEELEEATGNFDPGKELGDGGFGTVYHGILKDGREVAIKRLYENNYKRVEQFMNEIKILTCLKHQNLVTLYGCTSRRSRELLLVYEYIQNGTVADHLHGERAKESPLTWDMRMNIAIESASALAYLHKSDIVHRDVKTNNILLDTNFCVKVADFGLSRLFPSDVTHISTAPQGTPGYVDPEYHQCYQLTDKSDVYSFGVVLIELISSMPAVDITRHRHEINLANLAINRIQRSAFDDLLDPSLGYKTNAEIMRMTTSVAELAFQCLQMEKDMRPSMDEVLVFLREVKKGGTGKIPPSPETDEVELLKQKHRNFQSSPTAVTDVWMSGSTTASSIG